MSRALALGVVLLALAGCASPFTFYPANHGYDPLLAAGVQATMETLR